MRRTLAALLVAGLVAATGCEDGPAGPGTLAVSVGAPVQLGAVQLEITGRGITGVRALTDIRIASTTTSEEGRDRTLRVVAFSASGAPIRIGVDVESTDASLEVFALDAADLEGTVVGVAGVDVGVER